jgi:hypothetical protein
VVSAAERADRGRRDSSREAARDISYQLTSGKAARHFSCRKYPPTAAALQPSRMVRFTPRRSFIKGHIPRKKASLQCGCQLLGGRLAGDLVDSADRVDKALGQLERFLGQKKSNRT